MIKKPDVLSDQQIEDAYGDELPYDVSYEKTKQIAQAQLDVCVKHYEPLIKELYEALKSLVEWLEDDEKMIGNVVTIKDNCHKTLAKVEK